jgi:CheY-like chemotaxis protein
MGMVFHATSQGKGEILLSGRILVVDDEEKIRLIIRKYGEFEGYEIDEAANGMEVVEKCQKQDYDLLVMDVMNAGTGRFFYLCRHQKDKRYSGDHDFCQGRGI